MNRIGCSCLANALLCTVVLVQRPAWGQDQTQSLAANCTGCHGSNGVSAGAIPTLAGLEKAYIVTAMQEFKAGTRQATVMHQHAKGYSDEQIEQLAEFFASQKLD